MGWMFPNDITPCSSHDVAGDGVPQDGASLSGGSLFESEWFTARSAGNTTQRADRSDGEPFSEIDPTPSSLRRETRKRDSVAGFRVLHVDDEADYIEMTTRKFESEPVEIIGATSVADAIKLLRDDPEAIDCIISDYRMPGMNGYDLYKMVTDEDVDIPFIFFTSKPVEDTVIDTDESSLTDFIMKNGPGQFSKLADSILTILTEETQA